MCQDCRDNPNKTAALRNARAAARSGNGFMAQYWIDRAASFADVSERQVTRINTLLTEARTRRAQRAVLLTPGACV